MRLMFCVENVLSTILAVIRDDPDGGIHSGMFGLYSHASTHGGCLYWLASIICAAMQYQPMYTMRGSAMCLVMLINNAIMAAVYSAVA